MSLWELYLENTLVAAAQLGPFTYSSVVLAAGIGWWLWDERIDLLTVMGMVLVFTGGMLTLRRSGSAR